jgi:glycosyltransferase involved in cell wall biosynthesis
LITPLISVVLPVYNAEAYLQEAVTSILQQSYTHFEFILINDGSTDNSEKICLAFNDKRIIYIKNETNLGLITTLNKGISLAKGEYIARMDADDVALPNRFKMQIEAFQRYTDALVVSSDYYSLNGSQKTKVCNRKLSDEMKTTLLFATCFCHPTVMIKNNFAKLNLCYDATSKHVEDYKLWMDLSFHGKFYNVAEPLLLYRSHPQQVSALYNDTQLKNSNLLRENYLKQLGFTFTEDELRIHNSIGNNEFITSLEQLKAIEKWLLNLVQQNQKLKMFEEQLFINIMYKFWLDSCGNTNLGFKAFNCYKHSALKNLLPQVFYWKWKLALKLLIRINE